MTGNEYQKLAMRTCSIPADKKNDRLKPCCFWAEFRSWGGCRNFTEGVPGTPV